MLKKKRMRGKKKIYLIRQELRQTYIVNFRANGRCSAGNHTTEYKEYSTNAAGYCYGGASDAAYLGTENGKGKFMQSGVVD